MKQRALCVVLAVLTAFPTLAQNFSEAVQVTVVEVPVTVIDRAGKPVRGLTVNDFELYDDGKRVPITGFDALELSTLTTDTSKPLPPAAYRNFLLLFDLAHSSPGNVGRAQSAAREFVTKHIGRRDLVAVATYGAEHGLALLTSFTADRALLEHAITTLGAPKWFRTPDPLRIATPSLSSSQPGQERPNVTEAPGAALEELQREMNTFSQARHDDEQRTKLRGQFKQFSGVARALDRLKGQKQIILLSEGFDPKLVQGRQDLSAQGTQQQNAAVESGEIWKVDSDERFGSASSSREIDEMSTIFRRSDVTLHAIDIKGLRTEVDAAAGRKVASNESLFLIARPTGGTVFQNANDLAKNFAELVEQQDVVYLLSFEAKGGGAAASKYHKLKVKVPNAKAGRVQHRDGYYEASSKVSPIEQNLTLAEIMMTDIPVDDVPLSLFAVGMPSREGDGRVPVHVELPGPKLLEGVTGNSITANLFVYAFDEQNQVKDFLQQRVALDVAKSGDQLRNGGMRYVGTLRVPPGKYAIKALTRIEETGKVGFTRTNVVVPAGKTPAVLAPVFLGQRANWINIAAPGRSADAVSAFSATGQAYTPSLQPKLATPGAYRIAVFLHETPSDKLSITPALIGSDGVSKPATVALIGRTETDPQGSSKVVLEFKPPQLAAGNYQLQLTVKPEGGTASVVTMPFSVE
ncbi:MAG TPA: VWA domain-containing protein [Thermoanaerobaculia bacterium]|nr:VWA domain-containing protein [Thermoanaerobaculia bacterium]